MTSTLYTDTNLLTSVAGYLANRFTESNWAVYWQATDITSGTATVGTVSIVAEFPNEPNLLVFPPATRVGYQVVLPAFSLQIVQEPAEQFRAGLGEDLFEQRVTVQVDGFAVDKAQSLAFATMLRNWFRKELRVPIWDFDGNPTTPALIDNDVLIDNRTISRTDFVDLPQSVRYYLTMTIDLIFFD